MDILFLYGIKINSTIGWYDWERVQQRALILDLDLHLQQNLASESDNIEDAIDYAKLQSRIKTFAAESDYRLIEALAENIANVILSEYPISQVKVRLSKPGVLSDVASVGIEIIRKQ